MSNVTVSYTSSSAVPPSLFLVALVTNRSTAFSTSSSTVSTDTALNVSVRLPGTPVTIAVLKITSSSSSACVTVTVTSHTIVSPTASAPFTHAGSMVTRGSATVKSVIVSEPSLVTVNVYWISSNRSAVAAPPTSTKTPSFSRDIAASAPDMPSPMDNEEVWVAIVAAAPSRAVAV